MTMPSSPQPVLACEWFALCLNQATGYLNAGPLGDVPICDRCSAKVAAIMKGTR